MYPLYWWINLWRIRNCNTVVVNTERWVTAHVQRWAAVHPAFSTRVGTRCPVCRLVADAALIYTLQHLCPPTDDLCPTTANPLYAMELFFHCLLSAFLAFTLAFSTAMRLALIFESFLQSINNHDYRLLRFNCLNYSKIIL